MMVFSNYLAKYIQRHVRQRPVFASVCNKYCPNLTKVEFKYMLRNFDDYFYEKRSVELNFVNRRWADNIEFQIEREFSVKSFILFTKVNFMAYENYPERVLLPGSTFTVSPDIFWETYGIHDVHDEIPIPVIPFKEAKPFNWKKEGF